MFVIDGTGSCMRGHGARQLAALRALIAGSPGPHARQELGVGQWSTCFLPRLSRSQSACIQVARFGSKTILRGDCDTCSVALDSQHGRAVLGGSWFLLKLPKLTLHMARMLLLT